MSMHICPDCGTNLYNTATGWLHYNTGTESCYDGCPCGGFGGDDCPQIERTT